MAGTEALAERALDPGDLPALMALVDEAGWNQTEADWQRMLTLGTGRGIADTDGRVIASALTLTYGGKIGWIGMVLVAGPWRRRGLATRLVHAAVAHLRKAGLTAALDATPAGEKVYEKMGFSGDLEIIRWRRSGQGTGADQGDGHNRLAPWMARLDARAFGADRSALLHSYGGPDGLPTRAKDRTAFLFQRHGRTARHLGPVCAGDEAAALDLVARAIAETDAPLLIDVPRHQIALSQLLTGAGFTPERPFRRMYHGAQVGAPSLLYAIAGPELG